MFHTSEHTIHSICNEGPFFSIQRICGGRGKGGGGGGEEH